MKKGITMVLSRTDLTGRIIHAFFEVYNQLGYGFLESVYEEALVIAIADEGIVVERQVPSIVHFRGRPIAEFRADIVVERRVVVELKAARALNGAHEAQLLNYLRATQIEVGLLFNFGPRPGFRRMVLSRSGRFSGVTSLRVQ